ncbi:MAG: hypothetical protein IH987_18555 [Planctomycetes bacterium]|nr:hypothetical protein [Planctomycetota bacterium]
MCQSTIPCAREQPCDLVQRSASLPGTAPAAGNPLEAAYPPVGGNSEPNADPIWTAT